MKTTLTTAADVLGRMLSSGDYGQQLAALRMFDETEGSDALLPLLAELATRESYFRDSARRYFARRLSREPRLMEALWPQVRVASRAALLAAAQMAEPMSEGLLRAAAGLASKNAVWAPDEGLKLAAAGLLADQRFIRYAPGVDPFYQWLTDASPDGRWHRAATKVLTNAGDRGARSLRYSLRSPQCVRFEARWCGMGDRDEAHETVIAVRAAKALGQMGPDAAEAIPTLKFHVMSGQSAVAEACIRALRELRTTCRLNGWAEEMHHAFVHGNLRVFRQVCLFLAEEAGADALDLMQSWGRNASPRTRQRISEFRNYLCRRLVASARRRRLVIVII